jgi:hypothetical protein
MVVLFGPVVTDESDPLFMGADGHSNNTGELQAVAEALLWLKDRDTERSLSPVQYYSALSTLRMPFKGPARCIRTVC